MNTIESGGTQTCWRNGVNRRIFKFSKCKVLYMGSRGFCSAAGWDGLVPGSSAGKFLEFASWAWTISVYLQQKWLTAFWAVGARGRAHSGNQDNCSFPFTYHSLECYKATLSSFSQVHPGKTLIKSIIECLGLQETLNIIWFQAPLWAGMPPTLSDCRGPHPIWPWTLSGMGNLQFLNTACSCTSPPSQ